MPSSLPLLKLLSATSGLASSALLCINNNNNKRQQPQPQQDFVHLDELPTLQPQAPPPPPLPQPRPPPQQPPSPHHQQSERFKRAVADSRDLAVAKLYESGSPGLVVAVAVDGRTMWKHGFGYADLENRLLASPSTVMRIASISKALTAAAAARLVEQGRLDLDRPVADYVEGWRKRKRKEEEKQDSGQDEVDKKSIKRWSTTTTADKKSPSNNNNDDAFFDLAKGITARQLLSHMAGIRHYHTKEEIDEEEERKKRRKDNKSPKEDDNGGKDGRFKEFHMNQKFESVEKALEIFRDDKLLSRPGSEFHYTTHGFTLLSAAVESASGESFEKHMRRTFRDLGLRNTFLDDGEEIVHNRAR